MIKWNIHSVEKNIYVIIIVEVLRFLKNKARWSGAIFIFLLSDSHFIFSSLSQ